MKPPIGTKHGRLTVSAYRTITRQALFVTCQCGRTKTISVENLARTWSCGCLNAERGAAQLRTHGYHGTPTHSIWQAMISRCYHQKHASYKNYGGRGISVCDRWRESFVDFLADMGARPEGKSIERIDNDGNYEPDNCKWATTKEQNNNRRKRRSKWDIHIGGQA